MTYQFFTSVSNGLTAQSDLCFHKLPPPCPAGVVHADLKLFLETNLPLAGKKKAVLGVSDAKVGAALQEEFNISIQTGGVVAEISRGEEAVLVNYFCS